MRYNNIILELMITRIARLILSGKSHNTYDLKTWAGELDLKFQHVEPKDNMRMQHALALLRKELEYEEI